MATFELEKEVFLGHGEVPVIIEYNIDDIGVEIVAIIRADNFAPLHTSVLCLAIEQIDLDELKREAADYV